MNRTFEMSVSISFRLSTVCGLNCLYLQLSGDWQHGCQSATEMGGGWTTDQNIK